MSLLFFFVLLGAFVGFVSGMLGVGGGGILVPVLTSVFLYLDVSIDHVIHLALGTSMACIVITSLSSMMAHQKLNGVIWDLVKVMSPGVIVGSFLGTFLTTYLSTKFLAIFFAVFMAHVSYKMLVNSKPKESQASPRSLELLAVSTIIGSISAMVSIGGGSLTVPYLNWRNLELRKAIGTSAALGFPIAISGSLGFLINGMNLKLELPYTIGLIYIPAVIFIAVSSFFAAPYGAKYAHRLPVKTIKKFFGLMLIVLSIKMVFSVL